MTPATIFQQTVRDYLDSLGTGAAIVLLVAAILCVYFAIKYDNDRTLFAFYAFFAACLMMLAVYIVTA